MYYSILTITLYILLYTSILLQDCADNDGHNTDSIDALTLTGTVPVIVAYTYNTHTHTY
jgi:hypothetical protein